jgi:hypothetical protein
VFASHAAVIVAANADCCLLQATAQLDQVLFLVRTTPLAAHAVPLEPVLREANDQHDESDAVLRPALHAWVSVK